MAGKIEAIFTADKPSSAMVRVGEAVLETGKGLVGDRYYQGIGTFSEKLKGQPDSEITLIESEEIQRFNDEQGLALGLGDLRRNLITSGIRLNYLVGHRFKVGEVLLEGIRLCEPCAHLARTVSSRVLPDLMHRAGLRARVLSGGTVRPADDVVLDDR